MSQAPSEERSDTQAGLSLFDVLLFVLRESRVLLLVPAVVFLLTVVTLLLMPRKYTAYTSFLPQSGGGGTTRLAGLAAQFGVNIPLGEPADLSPRFYGDLVLSTQTLLQAAGATYTTSDSTTKPLLDLWEVEGESEPQRLAKAVRKLRRVVESTVDDETGVVRISARTLDPTLSVGIVQRLLAQVEEFNIANRRLQAEAEQSFMDERTQQLQSELRGAEAALQAFLERNREIGGSSRLQFERERLERETAFRRDLYLGVAQAYERARIEARRSTPLIAIVERPRTPPEPDRRYLLMRGLLAIFAGTLLAVGFGLAKHLWRSESNRKPTDAREVTTRARGIFKIRSGAREETVN